MRTEQISRLQRESKAVTQQVVNGSPVALTKNGKETIVMMTIDDYKKHLQNEELILRKKAEAHDKLMSTLDERVLAHEANPDSGYTNEEMFEKYGLVDNE